MVNTDQEEDESEADEDLLSLHKEKRRYVDSSFWKLVLTEQVSKLHLFFYSYEGCIQSNTEPIFQC